MRAKARTARRGTTWLDKTRQLHGMLRRREREAVQKGTTYAVYATDLDDLREWLTAHSRAEGLWHCAYCNGITRLADITIDHRTPIAQGGLTQFENLAVCCQKCNLRKGQMTAQDFIGLLQVAAFMTPAGRGDMWRRLTSAKQRWRGNG